MDRIDPLRDIETINLELIFSDIEILERRIAKTARLQDNDKAASKRSCDLLEKIKAASGSMARLAKTFDALEDEDEEAVV